VLSGWASRYLRGADDRRRLDYPGKKGVVSVGETGRGKFQQEIVSERHRLLADEPAAYGGLDSGPSPYDLLNMALGACTSMTIRMYADRKKLDLEQVRVNVRHDKVHAEDCTTCTEEQQARGGKVDRFERELFIDGDLTPEQRESLKQIADRCPVHRTLEASSVIETKLSDEKS